MCETKKGPINFIFIISSMKLQGSSHKPYFPLIKQILALGKKKKKILCCHSVFLNFILLAIYKSQCQGLI